MSVQQAGTDIRVLRELEDFPLVEALLGRGSRRFARGGETPDGSLAYRSGHEPVPLSELKRLLVFGAMGGTTGWHFSITRHARYVFDTFGKFPGDDAVGVHHELRPGSSPGPRLLRPVLQTRRIPAYARRSHATLGTPGRRGE
jgi:hypothetical protein